LRPQDEIDSIYCDLLHYLHNFILYLSKTPSFIILFKSLRVAININVKLETKSNLLSYTRNGTFKLSGMLKLFATLSSMLKRST